MLTFIIIVPIRINQIDLFLRFYRYVLYVHIRGTGSRLLKNLSKPNEDQIKEDKILE